MCIFFLFFFEFSHDGFIFIIIVEREEIFELLPRTLVFDGLLLLFFLFFLFVIVLKGYAINVEQNVVYFLLKLLLVFRELFGVNWPSLELGYVGSLLAHRMVEVFVTILLKDFILLLCELFLQLYERVDLLHNVPLLRCAAGTCTRRWLNDLSALFELMRQLMISHAVISNE